MHRRKPVPSRGHSETECRRESLNAAHYLFLPGRSGRRRIGYDFIKLGNIAFLMSHVNIHLWCRGSPERGIPTLPSWPGTVLRRSPSSVLPLRHPADYGNSTHSVCPGTCSRSCVPMRMCPQKHMRWQRSTVKLYLICYLTIFPSSSNGRLPRILQQRTDRHCSRRGKPCLPIPLPKSPPSCHNLALPGLKGSGAVPEMSARAGKSCSRSPCVSCLPGLPGFSSGRIGGPIFLCSKSASNCS